MDNNTVKLVAVGDVTLGDHPVCFGHGVSSTIDRNGFDFLIRKIKHELSDADILFGNLETVLTTEVGDGKRMDAAEFRGKSSYAKDLAHTGFNVMSVANNHAMQHGVNAFNETVHALNENNISPVGIAVDGESNCFFHRSGDVKIVVIAYSLRPDSYTDADILYAMGSEARIKQQVERLKTEGYVVIISLHWGEEYMNAPSVEQCCLAHAMIDSGADLIIGHHPHVLQGVESYKHGYIVYSLGNFIADFWQEYARKTMIFKCTINKTGISGIEYVPIMINKKYQPELADDRRREQILGELKVYHTQIPKCDKMLLQEEMCRYKQQAKKAYMAYRKESYMYFLRNIYKYSFSTIAFSGARFIARRLGFD